MLDYCYEEKTRLFCAEYIVALSFFASKILTFFTNQTSLNELALYKYRVDTLDQAKIINYQKYEQMSENKVSIELVIV